MRIKSSPRTAAPERLADLERLSRFLAVAEHGSFSKAALALGSTQSALSLQIAALEKDCAARLFVRTGRGVVLTELGKRLALGARELLRNAQTLTEAVHAVAGVPVGDVSLGVLPSLADSLVPQLLRELLRDYPLIRLRIFEGSNGQIDEWLTEGKLDVAVLYRYDQKLAGSEESLGLIDSWLVGRASDALVKNKTLAFKSLHNLPLILPSMPNGLRAILQQHAQSQGISLQVIVEVDSIPTQKRLVADGFGYGVLAKHAVAGELADGSLRAAKLMQPPLSRVVTLASSPRHAPSLAGQTLIRLIRQIVKNHMKAV
jgi:LysR family transcriptional regulator, nitrogen assimilation regulatory protein